MSEAREIIAYTIPGTNAELCQGLADAIINRLDAAGFRILGPDEPDPVTLEKCADEAESYVDDDGSNSGGRAIAAAIRALGRKA